MRFFKLCCIFDFRRNHVAIDPSAERIRPIMGAKVRAIGPIIGKLVKTRRCPRNGNGAYGRENITTGGEDPWEGIAL